MRTRSVNWRIGSVVGAKIGEVSIHGLELAAVGVDGPGAEVVELLVNVVADLARRILRPCGLRMRMASRSRSTAWSCSSTVMRYSSKRMTAEASLALAGVGVLAASTAHCGAGSGLLFAAAGREQATAASERENNEEREGWIYAKSSVAFRCGGCGEDELLLIGGGDFLVEAAEVLVFLGFDDGKCAAEGAADGDCPGRRRFW